MYSYSFSSVPDLENCNDNTFVNAILILPLSHLSPAASTGLLCMSVRVLSPQSVVLTSRFVISNSVHMANTKLSVYSIERRTFGQCLCSIALAHEHSMISLYLFLHLSNHSLTHSYSATCSPTHSVPPSLTHSLTHSFSSSRCC